MHIRRPWAANRLCVVMRRYLPPFVALMVAILSRSAAAESQSLDDFNPYIIKAVKALAKDYSGEGYAQSAYSHDLTYGKTHVPAGRKAPETMCVAAVAEVMIVALNMYMADKNDYRPQTYLPAEGWSRLRPRDIRSHIWVDRNLESFGTADALSTFGVGRHLPFTKLTPGAFVNLNRTNKSGHAVVFISFIDKTGNLLSEYSTKVAGFEYFSSQGKTGAKGSGFGYKYGFFNVNGKPYCPVLSNGKRVDCGIIYSSSQKFLNTGYMLTPTKWDSSYRDTSLSQISEKLYQQNYSRGVDEKGLPGVGPALSRKAFFDLLQKKDTMTLSPAYESEVMPDDPTK